MSQASPLLGVSGSTTIREAREASFIKPQDPISFYRTYIEPFKGKAVLITVEDVLGNRTSYPNDTDRRTLTLHDAQVERSETPPNNTVVLKFKGEDTGNGFSLDIRGFAQGPNLQAASKAGLKRLVNVELDR